MQGGDVLVVTSKIVSKAEGRYLNLTSVTPSARAVELAAITRKDARIVELVLSESTTVLRAAPGVLVVQHRLGFVSANAGIDQSNIEHGDERVLLLPENPDASAQLLLESIKQQTGVSGGIVISDSHGRPFRMGNVGVAIGAAGLPALVDLRGKPDLFGRALKISIQGYADMIASASALLTGEAAEGLPVVHIRGLPEYPMHEHTSAKSLIRPQEEDLFR